MHYNRSASTEFSGCCCVMSNIPLEGLNLGCFIFSFGWQVAMELRLSLASDSANTATFSYWTGYVAVGFV